MSTGDMKAGMGMDERMDMGTDEILVSVLDLEACIYSLL